MTDENIKTTDENIKTTDENIKTTDKNTHDISTISEEDGMSIEDRHKVFVLYFRGLDRVGVPYGISDLIKKSKELKLPIPSRQEMKSWKRKYIQ